jgi:hypothetical protein
MVLREADVVWASAEDLFGVGLDLASVRDAMRPNAVLAATDGTGRVFSTGPFGELSMATRALLRSRDDAFAVAICLELSRAGLPQVHGDALWARVLARGTAVIDARA